MDCSMPGSSVHGILQARILEWVIISFSRGSSESRDQIYISWLAGSFFTTESPGKQSQLYRYKLILWPNLMNTKKKKKKFWSIMYLILWYTHFFKNIKYYSSHPMLYSILLYKSLAQNSHWSWGQYFRQGTEVTACLCSTLSGLGCETPETGA